MKRTAQFSLTLCSFILLVGCLQDQKKSPKDLSFIDKGTVRIVCDSAFTSVMLQQAEIFEHLYDSARIEWNFVTSVQVEDSLLYGSAHVVVLGKELSPKLDSLLAIKNKSYARQHIIAWDAILLIVHPKSAIRDSSLTIDNIRYILSEKNTGPYIPVFNAANQKMLTPVVKEEIFSKRAVHLADESSVIDYVSSNPAAIGFIPYATGSDSESEQRQDILRKVKILSLRVTDSLSAVLYPSASQEDIALQTYPLTRPVNIVLTHTRDRLAVGFVQFLFQHQASRIFLKKGMVPKYLPEREVAIDTGSLFND